MSINVVVQELDEQIKTLEETVRKLTTLRDSLTEEPSKKEPVEVPVNDSFKKAGYPSSDKEMSQED